MFIPPISRAVQVFCGGLLAVGRGTSAIGATVEDGWFAAAALLELGELSDAELVADAGIWAVDDPSPFLEAVSFVSVLAVGLALIALGLVIGMADFATVRDAMALARARWWGEREERTI